MSAATARRIAGKLIETAKPLIAEGLREHEACPEHPHASKTIIIDEYTHESDCAFTIRCRVCAIAKEKRPKVRALLMSRRETIAVVTLLEGDTVVAIPRSYPGVSAMGWRLCVVAETVSDIAKTESSR